jgi:hypothetical protein
LALSIKLVITKRQSGTVEVFSSLKGTGLPYKKSGETVKTLGQLLRIWR